MTPPSHLPGGTIVGATVETFLRPVPSVSWVAEPNLVYWVAPHAAPPANIADSSRHPFQFSKEAMPFQPKIAPSRGQILRQEKSRSRSGLACRKNPTGGLISSSNLDKMQAGDARLDSEQDLEGPQNGKKSNQASKRKEELALDPKKLVKPCSGGDIPSIPSIEATPIPHEATVQEEVGRDSLRGQSASQAPIGAPAAQNEKHASLSSQGSSVDPRITCDPFDSRHPSEIFDMEPQKMKVFLKDEAHLDHPDSRDKLRMALDESSSSPASSISRIIESKNFDVSPAAVRATGKDVKQASQEIKSAVAGKIVDRANFGRDKLINDPKSTSRRQNLPHFSAPPIAITQSEELGRLSQPSAKKPVSDDGWELVSKKKGGKKLGSTPAVSRIMAGEPQMFPNSQESQQKSFQEDLSSGLSPKEAPPTITDYKIENDGVEMQGYARRVPADDLNRKNHVAHPARSPASDQTKNNENDGTKGEESEAKPKDEDNGIADQREPLDKEISGGQGKEIKRRENKKKKKGNKSSKKPTNYQRKPDPFDDWESLLEFASSQNLAREDPPARHNTGNQMNQSKSELIKSPFKKGKAKKRQFSDLKSLSVSAMAPNEELTKTEESVKRIFDELFFVKADNQLKTIEESWIKDFSMLKPSRKPSTRKHLWSELWKSHGLELNFMHHLSKHLRVDEILGHVKLDKLDEELFKRIVSYGTQDHQLMVKVYRVLRENMSDFEAFRRITTLSRQVAQEMISRIRPKIENMNIDPVLFENSRSGEYEKHFDIFGHYGLNEDEKNNRQGNYSRKLQLGKSDSLNQFFKPKYPDLGISKREIYMNICGENEYQSRTSPRIHFSSPIFPEVIQPASYEKVLEKKELHDSLMSKGLNLNRLLTVVSILGLEDGSQFSQMAPELVYYKSKVLYKLLSASKYNPLPWVSTAERKWLGDTYSDDYIFQLARLTERLDTLDGHAQYIHDTNLRAFYSEAEIEKLEDLDEIDLKSKCMVTDADILRIESDLPSQISTKLREFEEVYFMLTHHHLTPQ
ncbi:hypothetical protein PCASD_12188 [Puccinia coronata f. sp. avenae]|uniref:Uncharacterized protein n=1 Tax=Puccinia coronata f. sp. avenae TaxID=200324 RepID=A0A2N5UIT3_9BASI|nr:hypothetical protein PCASD_12188 [Puccinia coronata f. sp. avenae]